MEKTIRPIAKQDINGVRTAQDLERKYNLGQIETNKKAVENAIEGLNKTNQSLEDYVNETTKGLGDLQGQLDGQISTWYEEGVPTLENAPASEWKTDEERELHIDDLYYDKNTGYAYRFEKSDTKYLWIQQKDQDVVQALALANKAKETADGKNTIFWEQPIPPYEVGDIWLQGKDGDILRSNANKLSGEVFSQGDWIPASKYTGDEKAEEALQQIATALSEADTEYYLSESTVELIGGEWNTKAPEWIDGKYMWSRVKLTTKSGKVSYSPSENGTCIAGATGSKGEPGGNGEPGKDGNDGVGIASVTEEYYLSHSYEELTGGMWSETYQGWSNGTYLWTRNIIKFTNGETTATSAICVSGSKGESGEKGEPGEKGETGASGKMLYATCSTAAATVAKVATITPTTSFSLYTGAIVSVKFTVTNTASNPTLNVNGTGAKPIYYRGATITKGHLASGRTYQFVYNGTQWEFVGDINTNDNTYDRTLYSSAIKAAAAITGGNIIVGTSSGYKHLKAGTAFDITYPILYASSSISSGSTGTNNYVEINFTVTTTQSITLTAYKPVFVKGTLNGNNFTPVSTAPLTQTIPTSADGYYYLELGVAYSSTAVRLTSVHEIHMYFNGKFQTLGASAREIIKNWCYNNDTVWIDGANLYAGSVTAEKIDVDDLSALKAKIGGWDIDKNGLFRENAISKQIRFYDEPTLDTSLGANNGRYNYSQWGFDTKLSRINLNNQEGLSFEENDNADSYKTEVVYDESGVTVHVTDPTLDSEGGTWGGNILEFVLKDEGDFYNPGLFANLIYNRRIYTDAINCASKGSFGGTLTANKVKTTAGADLDTVNENKLDKTGNAASATVAAKLGRGGNVSVPMIFNWSGQSGQPPWLWGGSDGTNMYVYNPSNFRVNYANSAGSATTATTANALAITGFGNNNLTFYQTSGDIMGAGGWAHYIMCNHGDGASYFNYTIRLPFWSNPQYMRQTGSTAARSGWKEFVTQEGGTLDNLKAVYGADTSGIGHVMVQMDSDNTMNCGSYDVPSYFRGNGVYIKSSSSVAIQFVGQVFSPQTTGYVQLGGSSNRWSGCYLVSSPNVSSDKKYKKDIKSLDDKYLDLVDALEPKSFISTWDTAENPHRRIGYIAQEVEEAIIGVGLTLEDCNFLHIDEMVDEEGNGTGEDEYSLNYDDIAVLVHGKVKQQEKRIISLETEVAELKRLVSELRSQ